MYGVCGGGGRGGCFFLGMHVCVIVSVCDCVCVCGECGERGDEAGGGWGGGGVAERRNGE